MTRQNWSTMARIDGRSSRRWACLDDGGICCLISTEAYGFTRQTTITLPKVKALQTFKSKAQLDRSKGTLAMTSSPGFGFRLTVISGLAGARVLTEHKISIHYSGVPASGPPSPFLSTRTNLLNGVIATATIPDL